MKLQRGLAIRILVVAVAIGAASAVAGVLGSADSYRDGVTLWLTERWEAEFGAPSLARCLEDPAHFYDEHGGLNIEALDVATGRSANPRTAPEPIDELEGIGPRPSRPPSPRAVFTAFVRGAPSGPCSAFRVSLDSRESIRGRVLTNMALSVLAIMLLAGGFVLVIVVGPLRRRIARLRSSAASVGSDDYVNEERDKNDELGDVARSIDLAHRRIREDHDALVASHAALERFLGDVAHDLRTPLTSLRLALEELDDLALDDEAREVLRAAFNDVVYASSLTENLKLASQLENDPDEVGARRTIDLAEVADRVALREAAFARRSGMTLVAELPDAPLTLEADPVMVEQALTNVLQNAIIHGAEGGRVEVRLAVEGEGFVFEVLDDGPGVPPDALPRLGERAYRSDDARARDPKGSGLGLAITSEVCERFGWLLRFEAREPRGLRVVIRG